MTTNPSETLPAAATEHTSSDELLAIESRRARRTFGDVVALEGLDIAVRQGELLGLLGPNGAGKTTFLSLVAGLRKPTSGAVKVLGGDPRHPATRLNLGTTPQETGTPEVLKTAEAISFVADHYPTPMAVADILERFGLTEMANKQTGALSGGQRRRLAVALAMVGRPRVVLLDEPTTGLDVSARTILWDAIRSFNDEGCAVVLTSHYLEEIEAMAPRVAVINEGKLIQDGSLDDVVSVIDVRHLKFRVPRGTDLPELRGERRRTTGDLPTNPDLHQLTITVTDADDAVRELVERNIAFTDLTVTTASLEDAFTHMVAANGGDK